MLIEHLSVHQVLGSGPRPNSSPAIEDVDRERHVFLAAEGGASGRTLTHLVPANFSMRCLSASGFKNGQAPAPFQISMNLRVPIFCRNATSWLTTSSAPS